MPWGECAPAAADCLSLKGFAATTLEVGPGAAVDLYVLHMEAGSEAEDNTVRADDLAQLSDYLDAHSSEHAVIIGGDWNLTYDEEPDGTHLHGFVRENGLSDVCDVLDCGEDDDVVDRFFFRSTDDWSWSS